MSGADEYLSTYVIAMMLVGAAFGAGLTLLCVRLCGSPVPDTARHRDAGTA